MSFFEKINIHSFKCLNNINLEKASRINVIFSRGNFGKTTFLEALEIMSEPVSLCRSYNYFFKKHRNKNAAQYKGLFNGKKRIELSWSVDIFDFYDRLIGEFDEDKSFLGYGYYQLTSKKFSIKKFHGDTVYVDNKSPLFESKEDFGKLNCRYYDCMLYNDEKNFLGFKENLFKEYILNFIRYYNQDVSNVFVDNHKQIMLNTKKSGYISARSLGSFLYSTVVMHKCMEAYNDSVVLIDNFDYMLNEKCAEEYIKAFLGSMETKNTQIFLTLRHDFSLKAFFEIFSRNKRASDITYTILDKEDEEIFGRFCTGENFSFE